mgnify:CR=1 FL=1
MDFNIKKELTQLGVDQINQGVCTGTKWIKTNGNFINSYSPSDGEIIAGVQQATDKDYNEVIKTAKSAFSTWRMVRDIN